MLVALLLPAIQASRESARRSSCQSNLRQLLLAFHTHRDAQGAFPPARVNLSGKQHGWIVELLPFLEEGNLAGIYRMDRDFFSVDNELPAQTPLVLATCPSTPQDAGSRLFPLTAASGMPYATRGAAADYSVAYLLNAVSATSTGEAYTSNNLVPVLYAGPKEDNLPHPTNKITDGMSHTVLVMEQAGRPEHYVLGNQQTTNSGLQFASWWMAWASHRVLAYQGYDADGLNVGAACAINCNNSQGIYSFHPGLANVAFCDGSVRALDESVSVRLMFAFLTRERRGNDLRSSGERMIGVAVRECVLCGVLCGVTLLAGCSDRRPARIAVQPVSGRLLINGLPAERANVYFHPRHPISGANPLPFATVTADGSYRPTTYSQHDGLPLGEYRVTVVWPRYVPFDGQEIASDDRLQGRMPIQGNRS